MMVSSEITPPHNLQVVIDFVNTLDVEAGEDRARTAAELSRWLDGHGLWPAETPAPGPAELRQAVELRESLRAVLLTHTHHDHDADLAGPLEETAERGRLSVRFAPDGSVDIAPRSGGWAGVLAHLLVPVAHAALDGTWTRVKACDDDNCHWAFYDSSRNRSGRWCDMAVCGNRTKVRTYRARRSG